MKSIGGRSFFLKTLVKLIALSALSVVVCTKKISQPSCFRSYIKDAVYKCGNIALSPYVIIWQSSNYRAVSEKYDFEVKQNSELRFLVTKYKSLIEQIDDNESENLVKVSDIFDVVGCQVSAFVHRGNSRYLSCVNKKSVILNSVVVDAQGKMVGKVIRSRQVDNIYYHLIVPAYNRSFYITAASDRIDGNLIIQGSGKSGNMHLSSLTDSEIYDKIVNDSEYFDIFTVGLDGVALPQIYLGKAVNQGKEVSIKTRADFSLGEKLYIFVLKDYNVNN